MPVCADPAAVLEQQVPMYHLDDDHRYIMIMGVGPEGSDGNYQSFAPFQIPIEYDYDVLDLKHIIQAQLGYEPDEINLRVAGDFRPDESKLGPIFGRWFKEGWHMQASVYPKGWKSALEKYQDERGNETRGRARGARPRGRPDAADALDVDGAAEAHVAELGV